MIHICPETNNIRELLPHALIFPNRLTAFLYERLYTVFLDLLLTVETECLLHLNLDRQSVSIPSCFTKDVLPLHRLITWEHILYDTRQHMADMWLAISSRWSIIKCERIAVLTLIHGLFCDIRFLPERLYLAFPLHEIKVRVYLLIQIVFLPSPALHGCRSKTNKKTCTLIGYR